MPFHPYLFFGGNCREAFTRYQEIFGGELQLIRMGDTPDADDVAPEQADLIIHAALIYDDHLLMGSDDPMSEVFGPVQGMMVSYEAADAADARRVYAGLAEGGEVTQDLIDDVLLAGLRHVRGPLRHPLDGQRPRARGRPG